MLEAVGRRLRRPHGRRPRPSRTSRWARSSAPRSATGASATSPWPRSTAARWSLGGGRPAGLDKGYYFEPTVLDLPDNANPAAQEEIFGPVLGVIGYDDLDDAVRIANDSVYGLSAQVYGADVGGGDRRRPAAAHRRGQRQHRGVQRLRPGRWLQAERPRARAGPGRHPRLPGSQAHGDRRAAMSGSTSMVRLVVGRPRAVHGHRHVHRLRAGTFAHDDETKAVVVDPTGDDHRRRPQRRRRVSDRAALHLDDERRSVTQP